MAPARTVADAVGERLRELGVDTVFGVVGSGNFVVTEALRRGGATFVAARHEGGAAGMADGWARVTGRVGVCSVHQGPGLTNALTAIAEAAKSRTPLLVLAGDTPAAALTSNFRVDQHDLATSVGAVAERVVSPATAEADAARAYATALRERRPVVFNMAVDLQAAPAADAAPPAVSGQRSVVSTPIAPGPAPEAIVAAAALLAGAQRPVIIGGRGAVVAGAGPALRALAERWGALLATSAPAKGLFAGDPFDLGIAGGFSSDHAAALLPTADVVLAVGATLNHWTTRHGALIGDDAAVVQVDLDAAAPGANRPFAASVIGDARLTAEALTAALGEAAATWRTDATAAEIAAGRWPAVPIEADPTPGTIDPRTLSLEVGRRLPADAAVVIDSGHFTGWPAMYLDVADPGDWLFVNGFQCVGLGLGCAVGAAVARPDRVTVAAVGDGGLFLALPELESAARVGARLLVVVYDDAAYGAEVHHFGPMGHPTDIVRFPDTDLAGIARAAGVDALTVRSPDELQPVWDWLNGGTGPLLVDAKVDPALCADWLADAFRGG